MQDDYVLLAKEIHVCTHKLGGGVEGTPYSEKAG